MIYTSYSFIIPQWEILHLFVFLDLSSMEQLEIGQLLVQNQDKGNALGEGMRRDKSKA